MKLSNLGDGFAKQLQVNLQLIGGFSKESSTDSGRLFCERVQEIVEETAKREFEPIRRTGLVELCSAIEYQFKVTIVEWAEANSKVLTGLENVKVRLPAEALLEGSQRERLHALVDWIYQDVSSANGHLKKICAIVGKHLKSKSDLFSKSLSEVKQEVFDQAFVVRNCLVHDGGIVNSRVSKILHQKIGDELHLSKTTMSAFLSEVEKVSDAIFRVSVDGSILD